MNLRENKRRIFIAWLIAIAVFWLIIVMADVGFVDMFDTLKQRPLIAIVVLLIAYTIRPFLLLPTTIMNVFSGHLLGLWLGFFLASIAVLMSSSIGYMIGRYFSNKNSVEDMTAKHPIVASLSQQSFLVVLISRLMYLPSDLINIPAGFLRIRIQHLILGTLLGSSLIIFFAASFGASIEGSLKDAAFSIDARLLSISLICVLLSLVLSWLLRRRFVDKGLV